MTAAPRPGGSTASETLGSLEAAGFEGVHVFAEPETRFDSIPGGGTVHCNDHQKGAWRNWIEGLRWLLNSATDVDAFLMVQDDVVFCRGIRELMERVLWPSPHVAFASLYTPAAFKFPTGWNLLNHGWYHCGALAWIMPPAHARGMVAALGDVQADKQIDARVGKWALDKGLRTWTIYPSLCDHTGVGNSALDNHETGVGRRSGSFPGPEFDARTLVYPR
jgi:hypothetical protein